MKNKTPGRTPHNWVMRWPKRNSSPRFLLRVCRHTFLACLCFLTLINIGTAQTMHQRNWVVGDKMFNFSPLASAGAAPTIARTFPTRVNAAPVNAMSDRSGNLFFYIRDYKIYNASHTVIGTLPDPGPQDITTFVTGGEVSIVPFVENTGCTSRYYIFYMHMDRTAKKVNLRTKIASVDLLTSAVTITDYLFGGSPVNLATTNFVPIVGHSNEFYGSGGLAASKETGGKRYLYFVSEYKVQKITITDGSGTNYGLSAALSINADSGKYYSATQAHLSDDGTKLAWASSDTSFGASSYFHIIGINTPNGNWDGTFSTFKAPAGAGFGELSARGVCFNDAGTKLFVTTGYPFYLAPDHTKHGIYVYDIAAGTGTLIPNSNKYGTSQLAKAANGLIYARSSQDICAIDPDTALIIDTLPMRADFDSTEWTIRYMPDQINGELADSMPDLGIDSLNISTTTVLGEYFENKTLRIKNSVNVTGLGTSFTMRSITFEMGENAAINLGRGTSFNPEICTFKAFDIPGCPQHKKMWKGIVAHSPDSGILINLPVGPTIIQDAIIGIDADGPNVLVWYSAEMRANETHLSAKNGAVMLGSCGNCDTNAVIFYGDIPLRDQSKGSSNGYSDGLKRTIQHVYIDNGYLGPGKGITFQGGQYGFYVDKLAWGEELTAQKFAGQKQAGIYISNSYGKNFSLNNLHFTDLENGIVMRNCKQSNFYLFSSTFTNVSKYGIDANGSHGSEFFIGAGTGDPFAFDRGNTFTNTGWAAVYLHNNADPVNARIFIRTNTITSSVEGSKGIVISEGSGSKNAYNELLIDYNSISNTYRVLCIVP